MSQFKSAVDNISADWDRLQKFNRLVQVMSTLDLYYLINRNIIDAGYIDSVKTEVEVEFKELCRELGIK